MSRPGNTRQSGFTLIELMVTVAVLAILAAVAVPSIQSQLLSRKAESKAKCLNSLVSEMRAKALEIRSSTVLTYLRSSGDTPARVFWDCDVDGSYDSKSADTKCLPAGPESYCELTDSKLGLAGSSFSEVSDAYSLTFLSTGQLSGGESKLSVQATSGSKTKSVNVLIRASGGSQLSK